MNTLLKAVGLFLISLIHSAQAAGEPLIIGTEAYNPPFTQQGGHQQLFGFDIDMMNALCKMMDRTCTYRFMKFADLLNAVATNKIDVAIDAITITGARSLQVSFSVPYLASSSRLLTTKKNAKTPFSLDMLNGKSLGGQTATVFSDQVKALGLTKVKIKFYDKSDDLIAALGDGSVDYIMADNTTAVFWAANSAGEFVTQGDPVAIGFGLGIAVNLNNKALLDNINKALLQYQNSDAFKKNVFKYIPQEW